MQGREERNATATKARICFATVIRIRPLSACRAPCIEYACCGRKSTISLACQHVEPTCCAVCITNCMRIHPATWVVQMQEARHLGFAMIVQVLPCACTYILSRLHNQSHGNLMGDLGHSHATCRRTCPPLPPRISRRQQISLTNHTLFACLRQVWF